MLNGNTENRYTFVILSINGIIVLHIFIITSSLIWKTLIYKGNKNSALHKVQTTLANTIPIIIPITALSLVLSALYMILAGRA